jgi:hypothetical protein
LRISKTTTATVTHADTRTVANHPGAFHATVDPARIKKTPAHSSSSGRDIRNTLQKRKKWATGSPMARAHEGSIDADAAAATAPRATTLRSTTDNRKPGENVATGTTPPLSLNDGLQQLAASRLYISQDAIASLLQGLDAHHGLLRGGDGVL